MARKKSSKKQAVSSQEFSHSPFKSLKGLCALEPSRAQAVTTRELNTEDKKSTAFCLDQSSFIDEMAFLDVKPLHDNTLNRASPDDVDAKSVPLTQKTALEESDQLAFLEAVVHMETTFNDEWPEEKAGCRAIPRRMKQVARGQIKPEAQLDLHGLTVEAATTKVRFFLQDASYRGCETVLIITGKGLHSSEGPVLREAIEKLLSRSMEQVLEWGVAPRRYGGGGALVVFLRRSVKR